MAGWEEEAVGSPVVDTLFIASSDFKLHSHKKFLRKIIKRRNEEEGRRNITGNTLSRGRGAEKRGKEKKIVCFYFLAPKTKAHYPK